MKIQGRFIIIVIKLIFILNLLIFFFFLRLHYEIVSGNVRGRFAIATHNSKGLVTVAQPLDYKQEKRFILSVSDFFF